LLLVDFEGITDHVARSDERKRHVHQAGPEDARRAIFEKRHHAAHQRVQAEDDSFELKV
jgi:hypothetical protein